MAEPKPRRATYQDVLDAPRHRVAEIVDGELVLSPRPASSHASVSMTLSGELVPGFGRGRGGPGGWLFLFEPELHLADDVLVPDLAAWRRERLPVVEDVPYLTLPPDWVCEVLSKSTEKLDRTRKLRSYAAAGVRHTWLINPRLRTLEVLLLHDGMWLTVATHRDDEQVRAEPFDALALELANLWADLPARASESSATYGAELAP